MHGLMGKTSGHVRLRSEVLQGCLKMRGGLAEVDRCVLCS